MVSVLCWFPTEMSQNFRKCLSRWQMKFLRIHFLVLFFWAKFFSRVGVIPSLLALRPVTSSPPPIVVSCWFIRKSVFVNLLHFYLIQSEVNLNSHQYLHPSMLQIPSPDKIIRTQPWSILWWLVIRTKQCSAGQSGPLEATQTSWGIALTHYVCD